MKELGGLIMVVTIIAAVLQIVLFFKIWVMCDDVRKIRKNRVYTADYRFNIKRLIALGDKEKAKELLLDSFFEVIKKLDCTEKYSDIYQHAFDESKERLESSLLKIGEELPEGIKNLKSVKDFYNLY